MFPLQSETAYTSAPEQWRPSSLNLLDDDDPPTKTTRKHLLNILSTLHYAQEKGISELGTEHAKKREQLNMSSEAINSNLEACIEAFSRAACFLQLQVWYH